MKIELNALIKEWASYNINLRNLSENSVKAYSLDLKDFLHFSFQESQPVLKSDEEIMTYTQKIGITKEKTVRLKNVVGDKKRQYEGIITREESTKSEAIISLLVNNNFKGLVFLESADESTFSVDQSTDYLDFFAKVISKHLESLLYK